MSPRAEFQQKVLHVLTPREVAGVLETWTPLQATAVLAQTEPPARLAAVLSYLPEGYREYALTYLDSEKVWRAHFHVCEDVLKRMAGLQSWAVWESVYAYHQASREKRVQADFLDTLAAGIAEDISKRWDEMSPTQRGVAAFHMTDEQLDQLQGILK